MFDHLTGVELDEAHDAADTLLKLGDLLKLERYMVVKLDTLRSDLATEQEDRRRIARS